MRGSAHPPAGNNDGPVRLRLAVRGAVQGVGFRPFVYRLAGELATHGWVRNTAQGVIIELEGPKEMLERFLLRLRDEKPPRSFFTSVESAWLDARGMTDFVILPSEREGAVDALVLPDIATCPDCLADIADPANRRYRYPFTNCTNCGPRYSIIEALPYDRPHTTMRGFAMCAECAREYADPSDRRFHAQPNACPACGPQLALWDADGRTLAEKHEALLQAAAIIRNGGILAMKGIGGFHLLVDARNDAAIRTLRARKHRDEKPLAVMVPDLAAARELCSVSSVEERLLTSPEAPIVLLLRLDAETRGHGDAGKGELENWRAGGGRAGDPEDASISPKLQVSPSDSLLPTPYSHLQLSSSPALPTPHSPLPPSLAPGNPNIGIMLPYTPLHHLLLGELGFPVVATSGNVSDEPICTDEQEALGRLRGIADAFLVHNRPIARHVDDSVAREMGGREMLLRRARGYAPLPIALPSSKEVRIAFGAQQKNTVALSVGGQAFLSQHIGDLDTPEAVAAFEHTAADLQKLFDARPASAVCDLHPDYLSTVHAEKSCASVTRIQHHHAHAASCMADNDLAGPVLAVTWDGTGYGADGTIWGGEFLLVDEDDFERFASLRPFRLPGGDAAAKEPRRSALGLLYEHFGAALFEQHNLATLSAFSGSDLPILRSMLAAGINAPVTSSMGRLFDAIASLLDLRQVAAFEGQAAMLVEFSSCEPMLAASCEGAQLPNSDTKTRGRGDAGRRAGELERACPTKSERSEDVVGEKWSVIPSESRRLSDEVRTKGGRSRKAGRVEGGRAGDEYSFAISSSDATTSSPLHLLTSSPPHLLTSLLPPGITPSRHTLDWGPMLTALLDDVTQGRPISEIAFHFHQALATVIVETAKLADRERVLLTGGCFQNKLLTELAIARLAAEGFRPYWHQRIPPNDGGISVGQLRASIMKK